MLYRIQTPHKPDCPCAKGEWHSGRDWFWPNDGFQGWAHILNRDSAGARRGTGYKWLRLICPANCPAVLLVNLSELERVVSGMVRKGGKK